MKKLALISAAAFSMLAVAATAQAEPTAAAAVPAQTPASTTLPGQTAAVDADKPAKPAEGSEFKPVAVTINPLSMALLRFGANVEILPAKHHAIVVNPFFQSISVSGDLGGGSAKTSYTNFGGELGYRFYTGEKGANGFFVGPFLSYMHTSADESGSGGGQNVGSSTSFSTFGGGVDLGGQHVFDGGFTIGGGIGLQYLSTTASNTQTSSTVKFDGVLPRFLLTAGWSF